MIYRNVFKCVPRHVRKQRVRGFLHNGSSAALLDFPKAGGAVVERAREDHADNSWSICQSCGAKQGVHSGPMAVLFRTGAELNAALTDEQMLVRRRHVYMTILDLDSVLWMDRRQRPT